MSFERMREEFEAWYLDKFCGEQARLFRCVNADQIYYFAEVQSGWDAWQASRAAIEVELPKAWQTNVGAMLTPNGTRFAIEAAGLKVKP